MVIHVQRKTIHRASFTMNPRKISVCLNKLKIALAFKIALMCHRNILLILLSVITVSFTMILGIVWSSDG